MSGAGFVTRHFPPPALTTTLTFQLTMTITLRCLLLCFLTLIIPPASAAPVNMGPQQEASIRFDLLIVYPSTTPGPVQLAPLLRTWPGLTLVDKTPAKPSGRTVRATPHPAFDKFSERELKYMARGLNATELAAMQSEHPFLALQFAHPRQEALPALRAAYQLALKLARKDKGLIWDNETRELYAPDAWEEKRLATWSESIPIASANTVMHTYMNGELPRQITLGMRKFGLPDIVVSRVPQSATGSTAHLINLLSQALLEGASVGPAGSFDLALDAIQNKAVRAKALDSLKADPKKVAFLELHQAKREAGDPDNRLIEIGFARHPGPDSSARQAAALASLFGADDGIKYIRHDDALRLESERAQKKLAAMQAEFQRGLPTGQYLEVKAPFPTDTGRHEWMWVELTRWDGNKMEGLLQNTPFEIKSMKAGQIVRVRQQDVFDYLRSFPDGRQEGNTTGALIEKMQEAKTK